MRKLLLLLAAAMTASPAFSVDSDIPDPARMDGAVPPYYNSVGPVISVGRFSSGLASADDAVFLGTIAAMKADWNSLGFAEMYVAAIRLYDRGYRKAATYWYYSAEYRARLFSHVSETDITSRIIRSSEMGFYSLMGKYISGYALGDLDLMVSVIGKVRDEGKTLPDLAKIYPDVTFKAEAEWNEINADDNLGMYRLISSLKLQHAALVHQRKDMGVEAEFGSLGNKDLPGELLP